jgi:hypothetical protein
VTRVTKFQLTDGMGHILGIYANRADALIEAMERVVAASREMNRDGFNVEAGMNENDTGWFWVIGRKHSKFWHSLFGEEVFFQRAVHPVEWVEP